MRSVFVLLAAAAVGFGLSTAHAQYEGPFGDKTDAQLMQQRQTSINEFTEKMQQLGSGNPQAIEAVTASYMPPAQEPVSYISHIETSGMGEGESVFIERADGTIELAGPDSALYAGDRVLLGPNVTVAVADVSSGCSPAQLLPGGSYTIPEPTRDCLVPRDNLDPNFSNANDQFIQSDLGAQSIGGPGQSDLLHIDTMTYQTLERTRAMHGVVGQTAPPIGTLYPNLVLDPIEPMYSPAPPYTISSYGTPYRDLNSNRGFPHALPPPPPEFNYLTKPSVVVPVVTTTAIVIANENDDDDKAGSPP